nr:hypothetical protein [uncultured Allomuricauda sp.]
MEQFKGNGYLFLVVVLVILILLSIFYGRNLLDYVKKNDYIIYAGLLALMSFVVINWGNKKASERSQKEITEATNKIVEDAVGQATKEIQNEVKAITEKSTGDAVKQITDDVGKIKEELDDQLQLIDAATEKLTNLQENHDILVQIDFEFFLDEEDGELDKDTFYDDMREQLTQGKFYELQLISNNQKTIFASEIQSFLPYDEDNTHGDRFDIDDRFISAFKLLYTHPHAYNPQPLRLQFVLDMRSSNFLLTDLKKGDNVELLLFTKGVSAMDEYSVVRKRIQRKTYFQFGFGPFVATEGTDKWPKARMKTIIKLRNGTVLNCGYAKTSSLETGEDNGFHAKSEIVDIIKPDA